MERLPCRDYMDAQNDETRVIGLRNLDLMRTRAVCQTFGEAKCASLSLMIAELNGVKHTPYLTPSVETVDLYEDMSERIAECQPSI